MSIRELLEECYRLYPRKLGKSQGMRSALKTIRSSKDVEDLKKAILKYRAHIERENTLPQYVMYFGTFMNQWTDWLEDDVGVTEALKNDKWAKLKERR